MAGKSPIELGAIIWWDANNGWDNTNHVWTDVINGENLTESFGTGTIGTATHVTQSQLNGQTSIYCAAGNAYGLQSSEGIPWSTLFANNYSVVIIQEAIPTTTPVGTATNLFTLGSWANNRLAVNFHFDHSSGTMYKGRLINNGSTVFGGNSIVTTVSQRSFLAFTSRFSDNLLTTYESGTTVYSSLGTITLPDVTHSRILIGNATADNSTLQGYGFHTYHVIVFDKLLTQENVEDLKSYFAKTPSEINSTGGGLVSWYDASQGWDETNKIWSPRAGSSSNTLTEKSSAITPRPTATTRAGLTAISTFGGLQSPVDSVYTNALTNNATLFFDGGTHTSSGNVFSYLALGTEVNNKPMFWTYFSTTFGNGLDLSYQNYYVAPLINPENIGFSVLPSSFSLFGMTYRLDQLGRICGRYTGLKYLESINSTYNAAGRASMDNANARLHVGRSDNCPTTQDAVIDIFNLALFNRALSNWEMDMLLFWSESKVIEISPVTLGAKAWWDANFNWDNTGKTWTDKIAGKVLTAVNVGTANTSAVTLLNGQAGINVPLTEINSSLTLSDSTFLSQFNNNFSMYYRAEKAAQSTFNIIIMGTTRANGSRFKALLIGSGDPAAEVESNYGSGTTFYASSANEVAANTSYVSGLMGNGTNSSFFTHSNKKFVGADIAFSSNPTFLDVGYGFWVPNAGAKFAQIILFDKTLSTQENRSLNKFLRRYGVQSGSSFGTPSSNWIGVYMTESSTLFATHDSSNNAIDQVNPPVIFGSKPQTVNGGGGSLAIKRNFNPGFNEGG